MTQKKEQTSKEHFYNELFSNMYDAGISTDFVMKLEQDVEKTGACSIPENMLFQLLNAAQMNQLISAVKGLK